MRASFSPSQKDSLLSLIGAFGIPLFDSYFIYDNTALKTFPLVSLSYSSYDGFGSLSTAIYNFPKDALIGAPTFTMIVKDIPAKVSEPGSFMMALIALAGLVLQRRFKLRQ